MESDGGTSMSSRFAYATLLTRPSYLAGAILLGHSLHNHSPSTPLIVLYTPDTLSISSIKALELESEHSKIIPHPVSHVRLPIADEDKDSPGGMVAERFIDTWTKLRVFELTNLAYEKICFLDSDMLVFRDPSPLIFDPDLQEEELLANHTCVCDLDHDAWAPKDWKPENCAYTPLTHSSPPAPVSKFPPTHSIFNSGAFVFRPTHGISQYVFQQFEDFGVQKLRSFKFPDQDFLNKSFSEKWRSLPWTANALKTWRYWHPNIWKDDEVHVLHYIVDKPWAKRIGEDGSAGYKGLDGVTHSWWWEEYGRWRREREQQDHLEVVQIVDKYVAGENGVEDEELRAIGGGAQDFAKKWEGKSESEETHGPVLRKPMLGERGHGPVVRRRGGHGMSFMADG